MGYTVAQCQFATREGTRVRNGPQGRPLMAHCTSPMRLPRPHHQPLLATRGPRRKGEFVVGLSAGRSWPIWPLHITDAQTMPAAPQQGSVQSTVQTSTSNTNPRRSATARGPGLRCSLRGAVDARRGRGRGQSRAGAHAETATRRAGIHARRRRTRLGLRYRSLDVTCQQWSLSRLIARLVEARVHCRSERNLCIHRSNSRV